MCQSKCFLCLLLSGGLIFALLFKIYLKQEILNLIDKNNLTTYGTSTNWSSSSLSQRVRSGDLVKVLADEHVMKTNNVPDTFPDLNKPRRNHFNSSDRILRDFISMEHYIDFKSASSNVVSNHAPSKEEQKER